MLDLAEKDLKAAIINMLNDLNGTMIKEIKEMMTVIKQRMSMQRQKLFLKKNLIEFLAWKSLISEMKSSQEKLKNRLIWQNDESVNLMIDHWRLSEKKKH